MADRQSLRFSGDAVDVFEAALRDFHQGTCSSVKQLASSSELVTMEVMRQSIVKTCLAIVDRYSTAADSSGDKQVA